MNDRNETPACTDPLRIGIQGRPAAALLRAAEAAGVTPAELVEAVLEASLGSGETAGAGSAVPRYLQKSAAAASGGASLPGFTQADFETALAPIGSHRITGIRLAAEDPAGAQTEPWVREAMGVALGETDLARIWEAVRGWWTISTSTAYLVALRFGHPLALFAVDGWSPKNDDGRRYALGGYAIRGGRRLDPLTGADLGAASTVEVAVAAVVLKHRLVMPIGAANPVAVLCH